MKKLCSLTFHSKSFICDKTVHFASYHCFFYGSVTYFHRNYAYNEISTACLDCFLLYMEIKTKTK